ncbi:MAG: hypothetical protein Q7R52_05645 [archaeon]|nr:hypothetical protein [archaeon]
MNIPFLIEKLEDSEEFKKFKKENPDSYLFGGFFTIDKEDKENKYNLDFFCPKTKEMFSFHLEDGVKISKMENISDIIPKKIIGDSKIDFDEIEKKLLEKMEKENMKNKIQKIMISLQNNEKDFFICTVFISNLGIIKSIMDAKTGTIESLEKHSFFDFMRVVKSK